MKLAIVINVGSLEFNKESFRMVKRQSSKIHLSVFPSK